jgi:Flp pilus assembly protein TadB
MTALGWLLVAAALALTRPPEWSTSGGSRRPAPTSGLPLALDLVAAALRTGRAVSTSLKLAAPALDEPARTQWIRVAALLELGADPRDAWSVLDGAVELAPVAVAARRSAASGARLAWAFAELAIEIRAAQRADALARAHRAGVLAVAPIGLCFLPAFVAIGVVPTIVGIASGVLSAVP